MAGNGVTASSVESVALAVDSKCAGTDGNTQESVVAVLRGLLPETVTLPLYRCAARLRLVPSRVFGWEQEVGVLKDTKTWWLYGTGFDTARG